MTDVDQHNPEYRLLILAPTKRDAEMTELVLTNANIPIFCCASVEELRAQLEFGASAVLLAEEAVTDDPKDRLADWLAHQPPWSDLPVLIIARPGADSVAVAQAMDLLGNVTVLERPTRVAALVSAVRTAVRARRRQYQTRQHLAERERSEHQLRDLFDNAIVGLHWIGANGTILRVNQAELDLLGYTREEYVGRHIAEFHVDKPVIEDMLIRLARGETLRDHLARMRRKDGSIREMLIDSNVLFENGVFVHTRSFTRDVTDFRRAQEAQKSLAAIVEFSEDAIISKSLDGIIQSWNGGAERLYGYSAEQAIGRHISLIIPPDRAAEEEEIIAKLRAGNRVEHFETVRRCSDGRLVDISLTISPTRDESGRIVGASKIARDITERKNAENESQRAAHRLRLLWEAAEVLLTAEDPETMLRQLFNNIRQHLDVDTYFNFMVDESGESLKLASYSGISEEEASRIRRMEYGQAICGPASNYRYSTVATSIQQSRDPNMQLVKSYGIRALVGNPLMAGDQFLGTLSFASRSRDEFRAKELEVLQIICRYVASAYERLHLIKRLRDADQRKDEFLAVLAHELRNPLAPIRNSLHILRLTGQQDPAATRVGEIMERQVNHLVRLVDDLLEVSRITRGKIELRKELVELAAIVRSAVETSRPLIEAGRHELTLSIPTEPITLDCDPVRLAQVMANLLNNSAKYTDEGGQIRLSVRCESDWVVISIHDNGVGIAADMLPRVFDLFTQVELSSGRAQGGLGIGLTLAKSLVEMHGGTVQAKSDGLGKGSEFIIRLPLAAQEPPANRPETRPNAVLAPRRVLVVDDNRDAAQSLGMLLKLLGTEVHVAYSGADALQAIGSFQPDVVLLDIGMPDMDGYEVARRIRQQRDFEHVTLIALTGWGQDEDRNRSQLAGFDRHLIKPADVNVLQTLFVSLQQRGDL